MSFTTTPNYSLLKPTPGADDDVWGTHLNGNADTLDSIIKQVETKANAVPAASTTLPLVEGSAAIGVSTMYARADHVHPAGGGGGGGASVSIADTPPATPAIGDMWFDSVGTQLYLRYDDGNSKQWVPANNQTGGIGEAVADGYQYARRNGAWSRVATPDVGRNLCHNSLFTIGQRGTGPWTANTNFTLDRWGILLGADATSVTQVALTSADWAAIGDESASSALQNTFTGTAGGYTILTQHIEYVGRLSGKTVTASFWAKAASGTPKLAVSIDHGYGTGGSPSPDVYGNGLAVTLSTTWQRYSATFTLPSAVGKVLGTNRNDYTGINFWYSAQTSLNARSGSIGVQSGTIQLWGVQLEIGSVATPLEKRDPELELRQCQRFYYAFSGQVTVSGYSAAAINLFHQFWMPVTMRAAPTVAGVTFGTPVNIANNGWQSATPNSTQFYVTTSGAGNASLAINAVTFSADL